MPSTSTTSTSLGNESCQVNVFSRDQINYRLLGNMPISLFGMVTNLINVLVFVDPEMSVSLVNHFLLALSLTDFALLTFNFFFLLFPVIAVMSDSFLLHDLYPLVVRFSYPMAMTAQTCAVYLTVLVSVHRFLGVCHPFAAKRLVTHRPVQLAIIGAVIFSVLINLSAWFELTVVPCHSLRFERSSRHIQLTSLLEDQAYGVVRRLIVYPLFMVIIPFVTLICVNTSIISALRHSSSLRLKHVSTKKPSDSHERILKQFRLLRNVKYSEMFNAITKLTTSSRNFRSPEMTNKQLQSNFRDRSVTMMLLAIVALFLGLNGLASCNHFIEALLSFNQISAIDDEIFEKLVEMGNILISLNSSTSIFIYLIFSTKYRLIIKVWMGRTKRPMQYNRVQITTAMAAHRALELSIIPDEAESRKRREDKNEGKQRKYPGNHLKISPSLSSITQSNSQLPLTDHEQDEDEHEEEDESVQSFNLSPPSFGHTFHFTAKV